MKSKESEEVELMDGEGEGVAEVERMDRSFHAMRAGRLNISELDPSLSLCFLCHTELDFDNLCIGKEDHNPYTGTGFSKSKVNSGSLIDVNTGRER